MTMQPSPVIVPDIELWAATYLRAALAAHGQTGFYVGNRKPSNRPKTVVVRRDGGLQHGLLDHPRLTVRVWDDDEQVAGDLARLVQALLMLSPGDGPVVACAVLTGTSGVPDDAQPQKYLSVELTVRGSAF